MPTDPNLSIDDAELLDLNEALQLLKNVGSQHKGDYITQVLRVVCRQLGDLILHMTKVRGNGDREHGGD